MPKRLTLSYYPWITQSISGPALARVIGDFAKLLETELRRRLGGDLSIDRPEELDIPDQLKKLETKPTGELIGKLGLLNPIGYALLHSRMPEVEAIAVVRRKIGAAPAGPTYKAQLYTHYKTGIAKIEQARGRTMAFGSPQSTSNFLVPALMLWRRGIHPLNGFARAVFAGGHDKAAMTVYRGEVDVGAGHDGVILDLKTKSGFEDAEEVLRNIAWSGNITSDPVAIHTNDNELGKQIAAALISIAKPKEPDSDGNRLVKEFWGKNTDGFETIGVDAYDSLLDMMYPLGVRADDVLRKI